MLRDRSVLCTTAVLFFLVLVAFWPSLSNGFIILDDEEYVTKNPIVQSGLTTSSISSAFTTFRTGNWHPLTWLSLQTDVTLFGPAPAGFHRTNLVLHALNSFVLYLFLLRATGRHWNAAIIAALFAVHPMRVESVAWVAERKDVLSSLFGFLSLLAYVDYARKPAIGRYCVVLSLFALSLLAKPMWVTLPCLLLLLDWWPLGRVAGIDGAASPKEVTRLSVKSLIVEKVPLFALTLLSSFITWRAQSQSAAATLELVPLETRLVNAIVGFATYLAQTFWPAGLAPFYPLHTDGINWLSFAVSAALIVGLSVVLVIQGRKRPYVIVGWLWYLGTLVPVIGLVQVGGQAHADRYSYLPSIGIYLIVVFGLDELAARYRLRAGALATACVAVLLLTAACYEQTTLWHDDMELWNHTLQVTGDNWMARFCRGVIEEQKGDNKAAFKDYTRCVELAPRLPLPRAKLGLALLVQGKTEESFACLQEGIALNPDNPRLLTVLGMYHQSMAQLHRSNAELSLARDCYERALQIDPTIPEAHGNLGAILRNTGDRPAALAHLHEAVRLNPKDDTSFFNLGATYEGEGQLERAIDAYRRAVSVSNSSRNRLALEAAQQRLLQGRGPMQ
jgi:hypothetical protein